MLTSHFDEISLSYSHVWIIVLQFEEKLSFELRKPCPRSYKPHLDIRGTLVGFTRIAVNFKFHSWFANFKLT